MDRPTGAKPVLMFPTSQLMVGLLTRFEKYREYGPPLQIGLLIRDVYGYFEKSRGCGGKTLVLIQL